MSRDTQVRQHNPQGLARLRTELSGRAQLLVLVSAGACIVIGLLIMAKTTKLLIASAHAAQAGEKAMAGDRSHQDALQQTIARSTELADNLKKHNLFAPPSAPQNPVTQVDGILGDTALIDGAWRKAGDTIGDVEIVAVEPTSVTIRWNGSEQTLAPIAAASVQDSTRSRSAQRSPESTRQTTASADTRHVRSLDKTRRLTPPKSYTSAPSAKDSAKLKAKAEKQPGDKIQRVLSNKLDSARDKVTSKAKSAARSAARPPKLTKK